MKITEQRWCKPLFFLVASFFLIFMLSGLPMALAAGAVIVDHNCTNITAIPQEAIDAARANLHIAYGHTSHGSQLTDGMSGLVGFANNGGKGLSLPVGHL